MFALRRDQLSICTPVSGSGIGAGGGFDDRAGGSCFLCQRGAKWWLSSLGVEVARLELSAIVISIVFFNLIDASSGASLFREINSTFM